MCDLTGDFKLCSCDGAALQDPDWTLERWDQGRPAIHRRGRASLPRFSLTEEAVQANVIAALDGGGCFDFDYTASLGDVLTLKSGGRVLRFRLATEGWTVDDSTSLEGWREQMVPFERGKVTT